MHFASRGCKRERYRERCVLVTQTWARAGSSFVAAGFVFLITASVAARTANAITAGARAGLAAFLRFASPLNVCSISVLTSQRE